MKMLDEVPMAYQCLKCHKLMIRTIIVLLGSTGIVIGGTVSLAIIPELSFDAQVGLWCVIATGVIGITSSASLYFHTWRCIGKRIKEMIKL